MPKVSAEYRDAKRAEIGRAAIACIRRQGFSRTTMADIIAESGASAGSIYSNFQSKADITRFVAAQLVGAKLAELSERSSRSPDFGPMDAVAVIIEGLSGGDVPMPVLLQLWAESVVDDDLRPIVQERLRLLHAGMRDAVAGWARARSDDDSAALERADAAARSMLSLCQGFVVTSAITGSIDPRAYLEGIRDLSF
jgi:AcrR family transcriptional regulator